MKYLREKVLAEPGASFHREDVEDDEIDCGFHVHPEYEIALVVSGRGTRFVGDNADAFEPGDLLFVGPMTPHHFSTSPEVGSKTRNHLKIIQFRHDFAGPELFRLPEMRGIRRMFDDSVRGLEFDTGRIPEALTLMDKAFDARGAKRVCAFLELLAFLADSPRRTLSTESDFDSKAFPCDTRINDALRHIQRRLAAGHPARLADVASKVNMTPQSFSRYFKRTTYKRFIDYVNEVKVGKACRALLNTDKTVSEICFESGFNNLSNFNRQFQKVKSMAPAAFRQLAHETTTRNCAK